MHRTTPATNAMFSYTAGSCRGVFQKINDKPNMQESDGVLGMKGEGWGAIELFQNYGFSSVAHKADEPDKDGNTYGPEGIVQFMGANRSGGYCSTMDDRRHRVKELAEGDCCMFRGKDDRSQFHLAGDGNYMSCRSDRTQRLALVPPPQQQQPQQGGQQQGGQNGQGGGLQKPQGQKSALDDNKKASIFFEQKSDQSHMAHGGGHQIVKDQQAIQYVKSADNSHKVDDSHIHMNYGANSYWCDPGGVYASMPPIIQPDGDGGTSAAAVAFMSVPGAPAGPPAPLD